MCVGVVLFFKFDIDIGCFVVILVCKVDGILLLFGVVVMNEVGKEFGFVG